METHLIQIDCCSQAGPPQLGITVEAPYSDSLQQASRTQQQQQQQQARDYRNHDYQNFLIPTNGNSTQVATLNLDQHNSNNHNTHSTNNWHQSNNNTTTTSSDHQVVKGLQITQIHEGSVIDQNGQFKVGDIIVEVNNINLQRHTFQEAQNILKKLVIKQSSHRPLLMKIIRRSASSTSSIPSTSGSVATVVERNDKHKNQILLKRPNQSIQNDSNHKDTPSSVDLIRRPTSKSTPSPHIDLEPRHLDGPLNSRRIGNIHTIHITKSAQKGFGFRVAGRDNVCGGHQPVFVTSIVASGPAFIDGRLREGDMLLEINGSGLLDKSQPDVTNMLKAMGPGSTVELKISRQEKISYRADNLGTRISEHEDQIDKPQDDSADKSLIDLDAPVIGDDSVFSEQNPDRQSDSSSNSNKLRPNIPDGPGDYVYDIPINDTKSAGLGLYLKYPSLDGNDLGIWIEKVITGGAAWKDGRLQPDDQILAINGIDLTGMSNMQASGTLTAAVSRGTGPEATTNTIRLNIRRRESKMVANILRNTSNRIEHSDILTKGFNKATYVEIKTIDQTLDSYRTAYDDPVSNSISNSSSNLNSQNDSALSPQTQASNSVLILSNSCNEHSEHNSIDKTNDTSSAISQITDCTNVPNNEQRYGINNHHHNTHLVIKSDDFPTQHSSTAMTVPKTIADSDEAVDLEPAASARSWDDDTTSCSLGGSQFLRDGFGRQSMSEKRIAQLKNKNALNFRRNQQIRDEKEVQRILVEPLQRQILDDEPIQINLMNMHQNNSQVVNELDTFYRTNKQLIDNGNNMGTVPLSQREVPVDVQMGYDPRAEMGPVRNLPPNDNGLVGNRFNNLYAPYIEPRVTGTQLIENNHVMNYEVVVNNDMKTSRCWNCGTFDPYVYVNAQPPAWTNGVCTTNTIHNGLENMQQLTPSHHHVENMPMVRAGTARLARNRKINESFRAAMDKSSGPNVDHSSDNGQTNSNSMTSNTLSRSLPNGSNHSFSPALAPNKQATNRSQVSPASEMCLPPAGQQWSEPWTSRRPVPLNSAPHHDCDCVCCCWSRGSAIARHQAPADDRASDGTRPRDTGKAGAEPHRLLTNGCRSTRRRSDRWINRLPHLLTHTLSKLRHTQKHSGSVCMRTHCGPQQ